MFAVTLSTQNVDTMSNSQDTAAAGGHSPGCPSSICWNMKPTVLLYPHQVFGEITSHAEVDYAAVARQACREIGYTDMSLGFDANTAEVKVLVQQQVPEIAQVGQNYVMAADD